MFSSFLLGLSYITLIPSLLRFSCLHVTVLLPAEQPVALSHIVVCANEIYGDKKKDQIEADEAWCLYRGVEECRRSARMQKNSMQIWKQPDHSNQRACDSNQMGADHRFVHSLWFSNRSHISVKQATNCFCELTGKSRNGKKTFPVIQSTEITYIIMV